jgi:BirA family biotin operon repressor/biotin-[acetyl-CoA-carboxylase] ligase
MDVAVQAVRRGAAEGTVIVTEEQTAGKGRMSRIWLSPGGSIALSVILYPPVTFLPYLVMLASLGVVHSIEKVTGLDPQIKWPNDVLINKKKVCGILTESDVRQNKVVYAIMGIGINVNTKLSNYPGIGLTATSIADEMGEDVSIIDITRNLIAEIDLLYSRLQVSCMPVYEEWRDRLIILGKRVRIISGKNELEGVAESVAEDGSLLLRHPNRSITRIIAGDVTLREYE